MRPSKTAKVGTYSYLLVLTATGCFSSSTFLEEPIPIEELPAAIATGICRALASCGYGARYTEETSGEQAADCVSLYTSASRLNALAEDSVAAGRVDYDPVMAAMCVREITIDCRSNTLQITDDACDLMFDGRIPDGEDCYDSIECSPTSRCDGACPGAGTCVRDPQLAEPCNSRCGKGLYCDRGTSRCAELLEAGDTCTQDGQCTTHTCDRTCQEPRLPGMGESCGLLCAGDLVCVSGTCRGASAPNCLRHAHCPDGQACRPTSLGEGVCGAYPLVGEPCLDVCGGGARCVNSECVTPLPDGDDCESSAECVSRTCRDGTCDGEARICN